MGTVAARLALVVQVPPEVNGRAIHTVAAAQRDRAAAVGADGLGRGVGSGGDGLVGVGVVGGFHRVWFLCTAVWYLGNGRFVTHSTPAVVWKRITRGRWCTSRPFIDPGYWETAGGSATGIARIIRCGIGPRQA